MTTLILAAYFLEIALILFLSSLILRRILGIDNRVGNLVTIVSGIIVIIFTVWYSPLDIFPRIAIIFASVLAIFVAAVTYRDDKSPVVVIIEKKYHTNGLDIHKENLIKEIPREPTAMGLYSSNGWVGWIDNFPHRRKLLEHLYTGHRELFNSLDSVMTSKDENKDYERITFNQKFSIFLNNIKLDPNNLKGACKDLDDSGCLQYYDENDSKEYGAKLVEMNNINWINKSS